jgi:hypothetical protein
MAQVEETFVELLDQNKWSDLKTFDDYHRGIFEAPYLPSVNHTAIAREYKDLLSRADLPVCGLVVSAVTDRLQVDGYRTRSTAETDETVWNLWQENNLDGRQHMVYSDSLVFGDGYVSIAEVEGQEFPAIRVESPLNVVVVPDPVDPSRVEIAAKVVGDRGWLYTDTDIIALRRVRDSDYTGTRGWRVVSRYAHGLSETPFVRFPNRMDSRGVTLSEIALVAGPQRRIIQTIADRLMVQRAASWRQRWVSGINIETDKDGKPIPPFRVGVDQLVVSENPDAKFGEWAESPFDTHMAAVEADVRHVAAISQTPPHLLTPASISNISAEALIALEAGLTAKVQQRQLAYGESWERAFRIAGELMNYTLPQDGEVIWADLERRSDAQRVDGALKLHSMGLPLNYLLERLGLSPQTIERVLKDAEAEKKKAIEASAAAYGLTPGQGPLEAADDTPASKE